MYIRFASQQPVHFDRLRLPNPMRSSLRLQIILRVPIGVENDHGVGRRQVQPEPPRFGRQEHDEHVPVREALKG